jgi:uncharacterized protein YfdQ (DUF2303 family)
MFDKEAIIALQQGASITSALAALQGRDSTDHLAALPSDFKLHDLEQYLPNRRRARGTMSTESVQDFAKYFQDHVEQGTVFVDKDTMKAVGILNLGNPEHGPGHADNKAVLSLKSLAAYDALRKVANGQAQTQTAVAEWMEDWQDLITCFNHPDGEDIGGKITITKAIAAVRSITIDAARKVESEEGQLSASKSAFESVKASSKHTLPTHIYFETVPYMGLQARTFVLRLGILTTGDKTSIVLRPAKMEEHQQEMAQEFAGIVVKSLEATSYPVLIGSYSKS